MRDFACFTIIWFALGLSGCSADTPPPVTEQEPVTLYTNGTIWTGAGAEDASVMVVSGGVLTYVGDGANIRVAATETVDLEGRFVMPGFIDSHVHFYDGGLGLASVDLRDAATPEEFTQRITSHVSTMDANRWVLSGNWDHENWGGELPTKAWIDEFTENNPVFIYRIDGHMALANSAALDLAGITSATVTPQGGEIVRDSNNDPTGILKDNALALVAKVIPAPTKEERLEIFELAQEHALSLGLTQVHTVSASPSESFLIDAFKYAKAQGKMKIRVNVYSPL